MLVLLNGWNNDFYNALQQRAFESFWPLIGQFAGFAFLHIIFAVYAIYVGNQMAQLDDRQISGQMAGASDLLSSTGSWSGRYG